MLWTTKWLVFMVAFHSRKVSDGSVFYFILCVFSFYNFFFCIIKSYFENERHTQVKLNFRIISFFFEVGREWCITLLKECKNTQEIWGVSIGHRLARVWQHQHHNLKSWIRLSFLCEFFFSWVGGVVINKAKTLFYTFFFFFFGSDIYSFLHSHSHSLSLHATVCFIKWQRING